MRGRMSVWWLSNSILHQTPKSHNGLSFRVSKKSEGLIHSKPDQMQRPIMASFSVFLWHFASSQFPQQAQFAQVQLSNTRLEQV